MNLLKAHQAATELLIEHGLADQGWYFQWDNARTRFGLCNTLYRRIQLSRPLTQHREEEAVMQTILHEVAHALTPGHNHDRAWLAKARSLGYTGGRCSSDGVAEVAATSRWVGICDRCNAEFPRYKRPTGRHRHIKDGGTIRFYERRSR